MLFNSFTFIVFFITVSILYFIIPHSVRWVLLLAASFVFYMAWNPYLIVLILFTIFAYLFGKKEAAQKTHFNIFNACGFWPAVYF